MADSLDPSPWAKEDEEKQSQKNASFFSRELLLNHCLDLMTQVGWDAFSFEQVAFKTDIPVEKFTFFSSKEEVLEAFLKRIHEQIDQNLNLPDGISFRDALLESFMIRFEKLTPYKALVQKLYNQSFQSPCLGVFLFKKIPEEIYRPISLIDKKNSIGYKYFTFLVYSQIFDIWLLDDSTDLSRTLFSIDQLLSNYSIFLNFLKKIS